jgi:nucleotide-binding universal stress UspA family protein
MPLAFNETILACVDGSTYSEAVRDYGVHFAKSTKIPLTLFNTVEHFKPRQSRDLSGNITLGGRDELLEFLVEEDHDKSKADINFGRQILENLKSTIPEGIAITSLQRHGNLFENVQDLEPKMRMLILGLSGQKHEGQDRVVGEQVEEVIRSLHVPILLVNSSFVEPKKVMIAYDGSDSAKKALEAVVKTPLLGDVERHIVCAQSTSKKANETLEEAKKLANNEDMIYAPLEGEAIQKLCEYQENNDIHMIAMGAFSHNRLRDKLFGSFTAKMIAGASVPLLLLR